MHTILLIDQEPQAIQDMLTLYGYEIDVATDGYAGIQQFFQRQNQYELIIVDAQSPKMDGLSILKTIRNGDENPYVPIVMTLSGDKDLQKEEHYVACLRRGADLCLQKPLKHSLLLAYIESILRRKEWEALKANQKKPDATAAGPVSPISLLTPRENEILKLLVQGCSNQEISKKLVISETTVKNHLAHIFKKLKVSNRTQAAYMAQKLQMLISAEK